jgi:hypothetical protein
VQCWKEAYELPAPSGDISARLTIFYKLLFKIREKSDGSQADSEFRDHPLLIGH